MHGGGAMIRYHNDLNVQAFRDEPETVMVNSWTINYLAFCRPENQHKTPLVLVGGAFQQFHSFISDVKAYLPHVPVVLIALPGQSSNRDNNDSSILNLKDMADLLEGFFQKLDLKSVTLAGFSYGSLTAYTYAYHYESRLDQLILVGCTLNMRHAMRQLLNYGTTAFYPENASEIAESISQSLFNMNARDKTGVSMNLVDRLTNSIRKLSAKEIEDYRSNSARLLQADVKRRSFNVRALIVTAQYDHFVMPHESLDVYSLFTKGEFVMLEKGDHLIPLQSPQLVYRTVLQFLQNQPLEGTCVLHGQKAVRLAQQRRQLPRYRVKGVGIRLIHPDGYRFDGYLEDISLDGCGMSLNKAWNICWDCDGTWYLDIGHSQYPIPGFLRIQNGKASFVFLKQTFASTASLMDFIQSFQDMPMEVPALSELSAIA